MTFTLNDVVAVLDRLYPPSTAESWDAVGLIAGDPSAAVRRVLFAVDPVADVVAEALEWKADLLVTHHPLFLRGVHGVPMTTFKGAVVHRLITGGCALYAAHTNADAAPGGVAQALAETVGLVETKPLVPATDPEQGPTGLGRVGRLAQPMTLEAFARVVASRTRPTAQGVRVAGDLTAIVETIAVSGGSGDGFFAEAAASGADVYVTADLRHHPVSEQREQALHTNGGRPYLVDLTHYSSEWPWLDNAARDLVTGLAQLRPGREPGGSATTVIPETRVSTLVTDPWTARFDSGISTHEGN